MPFVRVRKLSYLFYVFQLFAVISAPAYAQTGVNIEFDVNVADAGTTRASHALASLGYKPAEVSRMVSAVAEAGMDAEEIIRKALQTRVKPNE